MCRWIAYVGAPIHLDLLLVAPGHSLLVQSLHAQLNVEPTNGDGFGLGWYGDRARPGIYRDTHPAWNDENYRNLAEQTRSHLFLAHVRAATGTPVQRSNCHPFRHGIWLFQHNGVVPQFHRLRREMMLEVAPVLFPELEGSTDSELMFYLALSRGLDRCPKTALEESVDLVERLRRRTGVEAPLQFCAAASDGERLYAVRYSSHRRSKSLFYTTDPAALQAHDPTLAAMPAGSIVVVSEPLTEPSRWQEVPEAAMITAGDGRAVMEPFLPG